MFSATGFSLYKKQVASFASQPLNRRIVMALLSAPEVAIAIAIGIAKTLIARSCVMLGGGGMGPTPSTSAPPGQRSASYQDVGIVYGELS